MATSGGLNPSTGYVSDFRVIKGQALYTGGFAPPLAPLKPIQNTALLLNMDKAGATDSSRTADFETVGDTKIAYETPYAGSNYSNYFDGTGDSLFLAGAATGVQYGTGDFTIEMWCYPTSSVWSVLWEQRSSGDAVPPAILWNYNSVAGSLVVWANSTTAITSNGTVTLNAWNHIAVVRSGTTLTLYVNGVSRGTYTYSSSVTGYAPYIGNYYSGGYSFTGNISNLRLVKGTAVYTAGFTPSTTPLTAVSGTSLLTCQSKSFVDNSSNAFTVTKNGDVAVKSYNPFQAVTGSSVYFDGTGDWLAAPKTWSLGASESFTIECWIYLTAAQANYRMIISDASKYLSVNAAGVEAQFGSTTPSIANANYTFATNAWYHLALVRNGTAVVIYINGVAQTMVAGTQATGFLDSGTTLYVGRYNTTTDYPWNGYIADLRVTRGNARYTANFTPPTAQLPAA
jgi:hypothetical protein